MVKRVMLRSDLMKQDIDLEATAELVGVVGDGVLVMWSFSSLSSFFPSSLPLMHSSLLPYPSPPPAETPTHSAENIRIGIRRQIIIHHQRNPIDIQPSHPHIGGNHYPNGQFILG